MRVRGKNKIIKDNFVVSVLEKKLKSGWFNNKESVNLNENPLYQFYRGAAYYRTYVLRKLLPDYEIFVV